MAQSDVAKIQREWLQLCSTYQNMMFAASSVVMHRSRSMLMGTMSQAEFKRMWSEKSAAGVQSSLAAASTFAAGGSPTKALTAALSPLSRRAGANSRRLGRKRK